MFTQHLYVAGALALALAACAPLPLPAALPSPGPYPVVGNVTIEDGKCCIGGFVGETRETQVSFSATSDYGPVTEMRVQTGACFSEEELAAVAWEPFVAAKTYAVPLTIFNWVSFEVSAQYRDSNGYLSPVVCDDIGVEGMPPDLLTPQPTPVFPTSIPLSAYPATNSPANSPTPTPTSPTPTPLP